VRQRTLDVELAAEFAGQQRVEVLDEHAARKEIGVAPAQLSGARSGQQKPEAAGVSVGQGLNGIEQGRYALHFIDEHRPDAGRGGFQFPLEPAGVRHVLAERLQAGEINGQIGSQGSEQGRLADLPRAE